MKEKKDCYNCGKPSVNGVMSWLWKDSCLVKKWLCKRCMNDPNIEFYGVGDMYTADEVIRLVDKKLHKMLKNGKINSNQGLDLKKFLISELKPTLKEQELKLYETD